MYQKDFANLSYVIIFPASHIRENIVGVARERSKSPPNFGFVLK